MSDNITGVRLRELRKKAKKNLREVGEATNIAYSGLATIERGERKCNSSTLDILATYYNVTTDYLLGKTDNPNSLNVTIADADGSITSIEYTLLDKMKGFTLEDFKKIDEYIDFIKSKKDTKQDDK